MSMAWTTYAHQGYHKACPLLQAGLPGAAWRPAQPVVWVHQPQACHRRDAPVTGVHENCHNVTGVHEKCTIFNGRCINEAGITTVEVFAPHQ